MPGNEWVYTTLAVVFGAHLMILTYAYILRRRAATEAGGDADGATGTVREDSEMCRCADCGTENETGYRFCKHCIAELPTQTPLGQREGPHSNPS